MGMIQPCATGISSIFCNCPTHPRVGTGRHFRICCKSGKFTRLHDAIRDVILQMSRAAGLTATREPRGLLPDEPDIRPADVCIHDWTIDGIRHRKHAVDFTAPTTEGRWATLTAAGKEKRASSVGSAALDAEARKRAHRGTPAEQTARGNDFTMQERCHRQGIHFHPIAMETDGFQSEQFRGFFTNVCNAAKELTDQNPAAFKAFWQKRIACCLHQTNSQQCLRRAASLRSHLLRSQFAAMRDLQFLSDG